MALFFAYAEASGLWSGGRGAEGREENATFEAEKWWRERGVLVAGEGGRRRRERPESMKINTAYIVGE